MRQESARRYPRPKVSRTPDLPILGFVTSSIESQVAYQQRKGETDASDADSFGVQVSDE